MSTHVSKIALAKNHPVPKNSQILFCRVKSRCITIQTNQNTVRSRRVKNQPGVPATSQGSIQVNSAVMWLEEP
jgi:hypothetical protein